MDFLCEELDSTTRAFMSRTSMAVREPISKVTMPLFAEVNGQGWLCATGVLLRVREKHFILTAAHVFDNWNTMPIPLNITDGVNGNPFFPIGEVTLRRSPTANPRNRLADDPYDICVCDISLATAERIAAGNRFEFLKLSEVDAWNKQDPRSWYTVFGFPGELNKTEVEPKVLRSNACAYATVLYLGERGEIPWSDADRGVGILMDYGPNTTRNDSGQTVIPPHPCGMSGGGMWQVVEYGSNMGDWSVKSLKLVGIQSAVHELEQVLRGTRIEHALRFIYRGHEDLRPEIEYHYGKEECRSRLA
jgi:hypothetical protein